MSSCGNKSPSEVTLPITLQERASPLQPSNQAWEQGQKPAAPLIWKGAFHEKTGETPLCRLWWLQYKCLFSPVVTLSLQPCIRISSSSSGITCTVVEMFQDAGTFPYLRITRTRCPPGGSPVKRQMKEGAGGEGMVRDWVGKARGRIGMAVGRVPNAHNEGQSLEPLCAGNTKRLAPCSADNEPMGVLWQLNSQRARGERCPSLSALSNRTKWHKDILWTWQKLSHPCFHTNLLQDLKSGN